jgi:hypothetical protein
MGFRKKKVMHNARLFMDLDETRADGLVPDGEDSFDLVNDSDEDLEERSAPVPVVRGLPDGVAFGPGQQSATGRVKIGDTGLLTSMFVGRGAHTTALVHLATLEQQLRFQGLRDGPTEGQIYVSWAVLEGGQTEGTGWLQAEKALLFFFCGWCRRDLPRMWWVPGSVLWLQC